MVGASLSKSRDNFVRLAETRTNRVLRDLDLLGNLSNKSNYSYDEKDVTKILHAISRKYREVETRFNLQLGKNRNSGFKL